MLITYIKGGTPAKTFLERGSAMTRANIFYFLTEVIYIWNIVESGIKQHNP
jgi:hypothetical protein